MVRTLPFLFLLACGVASTHASTATPNVQPKAEAEAVAAEAPPAAAAGSIYDLPLVDLYGAPFDAAQIRGKAVLFVNVASRCGFTPQYEGLQKLYEAHTARGLVIVGIPCNQFGSQEPGSAEQIASFCKMNYGVTFPLLEKQDVNGKERSPLYSQLISSSAGGGAPVKWNFEKFLVSPTGEVVARFPSSTEPEDPRLLAAIESVLPKTP